MNWTELAGVFFLGLMGTGHCLGMCGAFALSVTNGSPGVAATIGRHAAYQFGKATSYAFIGLIVLLAGRWLVASGVLVGFQNLLGGIVGLAMIVMGAAYAFEFRIQSRFMTGWGGGKVCAALGVLWSRPCAWKCVLIGWLNGLLPCGLTMMALLSLANTGTVLGVVAGAYVFGFSTVPGLLFLGLAGRQVGVSGRRWLLRVGGVFLMVFGLLTLVRGVPEVHAWMHQHLMFSPGGSSGTDCCH